MDSSINQAADRQLNTKICTLSLPQDIPGLQIVRKGEEYIQEDLSL